MVHRIDHERKGATGRVFDALREVDFPNREVVVVCIGSDKSIGDSLGPLVGSFLAERDTYHVYGTLDDTIHAGNLTFRWEQIRYAHPHALVVAVDAVLGREESIGIVEVLRGSIQPGLALGKTLPSVGNIAVTGVVGIGGFMEYFVLMNTPLSRVMKMARVIAQGLGEWLESRAMVAQTACGKEGKDK